MDGFPSFANLDNIQSPSTLLTSPLLPALLHLNPNHLSSRNKHHPNLPSPPTTLNIRPIHLPIPSHLLFIRIRGGRLELLGGGQDDVASFVEADEGPYESAIVGDGYSETDEEEGGEAGDGLRLGG